VSSASGEDHPVLSEITAEFDFSRFECGDDEEVTSFLRTKALAEHQLGLNFTRILRYRTDSQVLGFITMSMGQLWLRPEGLNAHPVGAIHIAYLGIQKEHHGKGWGTLLLSFAINEALRLSSELGCRGVVLNCRDKRLSWYTDRGFECYGRGSDTGGPLNKMFFDLRNP